MENIFIPVSPGELADKVTILKIKSEHISDSDKLSNVELELTCLEPKWAELVQTEIGDELVDLFGVLKSINQELWDIEDKIRIKESRREFDEVFIDLARSVYRVNDKRASVKRKINELLGSRIMEEKSYEKYD